MNNVCPVCEAPQDQGLACHACTSKLEKDLAEVRALMGELDVTISKQAKIGGGGKGGPARERTPVNWGAAEIADDLTNTLTTWARDVGTCGTSCRSTLTPASHAARLLLSSIDLIRRHPAVVEMIDEISDAMRRARQAVDRPADQQYLGQCLVPTLDAEGRPVTCLEEIYARAGASHTTCKVCGITHDVAERRAAMLDKMEDVILSVKDASYVIGELGGIKVSQASIRGYVHRGKLAYRPGVENGIRVGDLLSVILGDSERRSA